MLCVFGRALFIRPFVVRQAAAAVIQRRLANNFESLSLDALLEDPVHFLKFNLFPSFNNSYASMFCQLANV